MIKSSSFYILLIALNIFIMRSPPASANQYYYNNEKSAVRFELKHFGLITVQGEFGEFSGDVTFDLANLKNSKVSISIQTATVVSDNEKRDKNLMSDKFFWSEKYPNIEFLSKKFVRVDETRCDSYGNLIIRGISNPVIFKTELLSDPATAIPGQSLSFKSETTIKRKDYKLGTDAISNPIMFITDEKLTILLDVECIPA